MLDLGFVVWFELKPAQLQKLDMTEELRQGARRSTQTHQPLGGGGGAGGPPGLEP